MTAYVALMSVQFTDSKSGERRHAEPRDHKFHGVFEGLEPGEAKRLIALGAIREPDEDELALYKAQGDQTTAIEPSEVAKQLEADKGGSAATSAAASKSGVKIKVDDKDVIG